MKFYFDTVAEQHYQPLHVSSRAPRITAGDAGISLALVTLVLSSAVGKPSQPGMRFIPGSVIGAMF